MERTRWYKDKVFYQIWPRSLKNSNGDLWGVYQMLDCFKQLGMDGIWFSHICPSPGADCVYDISDYIHIALKRRHGSAAARGHDLRRSLIERIHFPF